MNNIRLELYRLLYLIRTSEELIQEYYLQNEMKTPMHMSMGAEAIAVGTCQALDSEDQVLVTYRSHGVYLAKTKETDSFFAEMYGKLTGVAKGKAGSMHLVAPKSGLLGASAIVASNIPVATGVAFSNQYCGNNKNVAVYFGDGAIDEGVFWESINMACLHKLRILFICEDNQYAVHTPTNHRHGYKSICEIVKEFDCNIMSSESTDVEEIYDLTSDILAKMNANGKPGFMHLKYYRYLEHVGIFDDFNSGYREKTDYDNWKLLDPVSLQRNKLIDSGYDQKVVILEDEIKKKIQKSIDRAKIAPFPEIHVCHEDVYA